MKLPKELQIRNVKKERNYQQKLEYIKKKIREYSKHFQLQWNIRLNIKALKDFENDSYPEIKMHEIFLIPDTVKNFNSNPLNLGKLVHELCHLNLAERIDPVFSSLIYSREYGQYGEYLDAQKNLMLYIVWRIVVEFWACDLFWKTFPKMGKIDHIGNIELFKQNVNDFQNLGPNKKFKWTILQNSPDIEFFTGYAGEIAREIVLTERFNLEPFDYSHLINPFGKQFVALTKNLEKFYRSKFFLKLSYNKENDVKLIFDSIKEAVSIFVFPIRPSLIMAEDGIYEWKVE